MSLSLPRRLGQHLLPPPPGLLPHTSLAFPPLELIASGPADIKDGGGRVLLPPSLSPMELRECFQHRSARECQLVAHAPSRREDSDSLCLDPSSKHTCRASMDVATQGVAYLRSPGMTLVRLEGDSFVPPVAGSRSLGHRFAWCPSVAVARRSGSGVDRVHQPSLAAVWLAVPLPGGAWTRCGSGGQP